RRRRLLRGSRQSGERHAGRLSPGQRRDRALQRGAAEPGRRILALQACGRIAPLLLRAAADRLSRRNRSGEPGRGAVAAPRRTDPVAIPNGPCRGHPGAMTEPFWKTKTLAEMTRAEWESLCDGCGRCCLNKLEEEVTNRLYFTDVGCRLLDPDTCRCRNYK